MTDAAEVAARLFAAVGVLAFSAFALRRWAARATANGGPALRVVARTAVSRGAVVAVVAVGDRQFLVGAGDHGMRLLAELEGGDDPLTAAAPAAGPRTRGGEHGGFRWLASPATHQATRTSPSAITGPGMGLVDRLREMTVRTHLRPARGPQG